MIQKLYLLCSLLVFVATMQAQDLIEQARAGIKPENERIDNLLTRELQQRKVSLDPVRPFFYVRETERPSGNIQLTLDPVTLARIWREAPDYLELSIPVDDAHSIDVSLYRKEFLSPGFTVQTSSGQLDRNALVERRFYHGVVKDKEQAWVVLTETRDQIQLTIYDQGDRYRLQGEGTSYMFFRQQRQDDAPVSYTCGTTVEKREPPIRSGGSKARSNATTCPVTVYLHVDYETYQNYNGNVTQIQTLVEDIFSEAVMIYAGINVPLQLAGIMIWDTDDSFGNVASADSGITLENFRTYIQNDVTFASSLAHLIHIRTDGGTIQGKADVAALCSNTPVGFSQIWNDTKTGNPDGFEGSVLLFVHELGHNLGADHTHDCVWGPNGDQPIDNCDPVEPECDDTCSCGDLLAPNITDAEGGTIMSYCMNQSRMFYPEVADTIVAHYNRSMNCACGGGESCPYVDITCGVTYSGTTVGAASNLNGYGCIDWDESGPEVLHRLTITETSDIYVKLSGLDTVPDIDTVDLDIFIIGDDCMSSSCIGNAFGDSEINVTDVQAGTYYVVVDGYEGAEGSYDLLVETSSCGTSDPTAKALDFDGMDDAVNLGNGLGNFGTGDFTIEAWIKTDQASNYILSKRAICSSSNFWNIYLNADGKLEIEMFEDEIPSKTGYLTSTRVISDNDWHHIAITRSGGVGKLYVDGSEEANGSLDIDINNSTNVTIGSNVCTFSIGFFEGKIDELRFWDFAKTESLIQCQMDIALSGTETGLSAYYNFNQGVAGGDNTAITTLEDRTSNNHDGTLMDFALQGTGSNWIGDGPTLNGAGACCPSTLAVNGNINTNTYQAAMDLTSDGIVPSGNTVILKAGNSITLQPNFEVQSGGVLEAVIEGCPTAASSR